MTIIETTTTSGRIGKLSLSLEEVDLSGSELTIIIRPGSDDEIGPATTCVDYDGPFSKMREIHDKGMGALFAAGLHKAKKLDWDKVAEVVGPVLAEYFDADVLSQVDQAGIMAKAAEQALGELPLEGYPVTAGVLEEVSACIDNTVFWPDFGFESLMDFIRRITHISNGLNKPSGSSPDLDTAIAQGMLAVTCSSAEVIFRATGPGGPAANQAKKGPGGPKRIAKADGAGMVSGVITGTVAGPYGTVVGGALGGIGASWGQFFLELF